MRKKFTTDDQKWRKNVKRSIKFFYFVAALPFFSSIGSADELVEEKEIPSFEQGSAVKEEMACGYNASSRIDVNGAWDVFINGSYILWQPEQSGLAIAKYSPSSGKSSPVNMDFDFHSGFKVAFGTNLNHDNWMAVAEYTRLHTRDHASATVSLSPYVAYLAPFYESSGNSTGKCSSAAGHWQLKYDMIDFSFGRPCYVGTHLTFKPFFGLRGGWIDQHLDAEYTNLSNVPAVYSMGNVWNRSNSWLVGPRAGVGMNWLLGIGFRVLANAAGSLNYQEFKTRHAEAINLTPSFSGFVQNFNAAEKNHQITPNIEGDIGLGWGTYFDNNNWHFDLLASYHFEVFWCQNEMARFSQELINGIYGKSGSLNFQGLTVTAQLDF
jgi:hypothetical protein